MSNKFKKSLGIIYFILLVIATGIVGNHLIFYNLKDFLMTAELSDLQAFSDIFNITSGVLIWIFNIKMINEILNNIDSL